MALFSRAGIVPIVYANGLRNEKLRPLLIERSAGGRTLDTAVFEYDLGKDQEHLKNIKLLTNFSTDCWVYWEDPSTTPATKRPLHRGFLSVQELKIGPDGEQALITSRLEKHHFGTIAKGMQVKPKNTGSVITRDDLEIVFNPEIDGVIEGNLSTATGAFGSPAYKLFVDPESMRTSVAAAYQAQDRSLWTLQEAVWYLLQVCNSSQTHVANPTYDEIGTALPTGTDRIKNHHLKSGKYLGELLDELLSPYECGWYVALSLSEPAGYPVVTPTIKVFRRWVGPTSNVLLQAPASSGPPVTLDTTLTNVEECSIKHDLAALFNSVTAWSDQAVQREITVELYRAWASADDAIAWDPLDKQNPSYAVAKQHVWRKWSLGEDGSLNSIRSSPGNLTGHFDLTGILGASTTIKRRRFKPCLTRGADGGPIGSGGVFVEFWDPDASAWRPVSDVGAGYEVLERECGIVFHDFPVWLLNYANADRRIRITACVTGDTRLASTAVSTDSANAHSVATLVVLPDFRDRKLQRSGGYASQFASLVDAATLTADEGDDSAAMALAATQILADTDLAHVSCTITLEGLDRTGYEIGNLVEKVQGRELSLNAKADAAVTPRYPQILAIKYDVPAQRMHVLLEDVEADLNRFNLDRLHFQPPRPFFGQSFDLLAASEAP